MSKRKPELTAVAALQQTKEVKAAAKLLGLPTRQALYAALAREIKGGGRVEAEQEKLDVVVEHHLRKQNAALQREVKEMLARAAAESRRAELLGAIVERDLQPPEWLTHVARDKGNHATIVALLSDLHLDEVVNPSEVNFVNAYNRDIAVLRLRKFFERLVKVAKHYIGGVKIDGLLLALLGDIVSGIIHEELERTNDGAGILDTCVFWAEQLAAGIEYLLKSKIFARIHVPAVTGNHGRLRKRPQYKVRARDNFDWLIYQMLARHFRVEPRVTFDIPDGPETRTPVYTTRFLWTHGDSFSGGNGIGGIAVPIMRGDAKKQKVAVAIDLPYDYMAIGHWHQRMQLGTTLINGTTKGYDEFTMGNHFSFEEPQQSMFVVTPERKITVSAPIFVRDKAERWN